MWKTVKLGDLCETVTKGTTPTSVGFKFTSEGINFVKVESLAADSTFITSKFGKINSECHEALKRSQLKEGDILFSIAGALGRTAIVTKDVLPANTNQALAIVRLKENIEVDKRFLLYVLNSESTKEQSDLNKGGVAQQNLSLTQLKNYGISLPPLAEQQRIVAKLDAAFAEIDRAIELEVSKKAEVENLKSSLLTASLNDDDVKWKNLPFEKCLQKTKVPHKLPKNEYLESGKFPVVSQEAKLISGYHNEQAHVFNVSKPVVIFGDHTQVLKYVDFDFVVGADGVKILLPIEEIDTMYFCYLLQTLMPKGKGYARHYRFLKELNISIPLLAEQQRIVAKLDAAFADIETIYSVTSFKRKNYSSLKSAILAQELQPTQSEAA